MKSFNVLKIVLVDDLLDPNFYEIVRIPPGTNESFEQSGNFTEEFGIQWGSLNHFLLAYYVAALLIVEISLAIFFTNVCQTTLKSFRLLIKVM